MKRTDKKTDTKKIASICGLSALSLAVLAGAYFLTREPTKEFVPSSIQTDTATDTWKENAGTDVQRPEDLPDGPLFCGRCPFRGNGSKKCYLPADLIFFKFNHIRNITIEHITKVIQGIESDTPIVFEII